MKTVLFKKHVFFDTFFVKYRSKGGHTGKKNGGKNVVKIKNKVFKRQNKMRLFVLYCTVLG